MTGNILEMLADPDVIFVVVAALSLTVFTGFVAILLPDRFCGPWLTAMSLLQLGLCGLLILAVRSDPSNDIENAFAIAFAIPLGVGGFAAVIMRLSLWLFSRFGRRSEP